MAIHFERVSGESGQGHPPSAGAPLRHLALASSPPRAPSKHYTRFVRIMKWVLPALAALLVALVAFWPQIARQGEDFRLGLAGSLPSATERPSTTNVRFVGTDRKERPFTVTADTARHLNDAGTEIGLDAPKADILLQDGAWLLLSAENGLYRREARTLDLNNKVNLFHDTGYEFHTEAAVIDLAASNASGDKPVRGQGAFGDLSAEGGFRITEQGRVLFLAGPARVVLNPAAKSGKSAEEGKKGK